MEVVVNSDSDNQRPWCTGINCSHFLQFILSPRKDELDQQLTSASAAVLALVEV